MDFEANGVKSISLFEFESDMKGNSAAVVPTGMDAIMRDLLQAVKKDLAPNVISAIPADTFEIGLSMVE